MNRGYVTPGEAGLIVFMAAMIIVFAISACKFAFLIDLIDAGKNADDQHDAQYIDRESDMCAIRVTAPCGDDDICRYTASVPCSELDALVKASKGGK